MDEKKIIENYKKRIKRQNEKARENWDSITCKLPKGTKDRIQAQGLTINGFVNQLVLERLDELESKVREVKHIINQFNVSTVVPGFDMTIDQMLVYIPQLTARKQKLQDMKKRLPKARENASPYGRSNPIVDYRYTNYDADAVAKDYEVISELLSKAQIALDLVNNTETMEIDV